jgi:hypothetical protein
VGRSSMSGLMIGGALFVLLGLVGLAMPVFTTQHTQEVARLGDLKLDATNSTSHFIPPLVSGGALVLGVVLVGAGFYRKTD